MNSTKALHWFALIFQICGMIFTVIVIDNTIAPYMFLWCLGFAMYSCYILYKEYNGTFISRMLKKNGNDTN